jgi:pilus assembly protein Flp/PilA
MRKMAQRPQCLVQRRAADADTKKEQMNPFTKIISKLRTRKDTRGQDLIEYALMAGFVAVAAGAAMPGVASGISTIFSKVSSVLCSCQFS